MTITHVEFVIAMLLLVVGASHAYPLDYPHLQTDGTFKLAFFTDLHFGEDAQDDANTVASLVRLLDMERPDFVVFGGDIFSDYAKPNKGLKSEAWVRMQWNKLVYPLIYNRYQWAVVLGNHDVADMTSDAIRSMDASFPGSWSGVDREGIPIFGNATYNVANNVAMRLYMFDSGVSGVDKWQMQRYLNVSRAQMMQNVPSLAFVHIPPMETFTAFNYDADLRGQMRDDYGVSCQRASDSDAAFNFLDVLRERNEVKVVTFGHNHGNNFLATYGGMHLAYGQKTGHSGYGHWKSGCRIYFVRKYVPGAMEEREGVVSLLPLSSLIKDDIYGTQVLDTRPQHSNLNGILPITVRTWIRYDDGSYGHQRIARGGPAKRPLMACGVGREDGKARACILTTSVLAVLVAVSIVVIHVAIVNHVNEDCAE